jgi:hypothetical protein
LALAAGFAKFDDERVLNFQDRTGFIAKHCDTNPQFDSEASQNVTRFRFE